MSSDTFVRESRTSLQRLSEGLIELERTDDEAVVDELFRTAHSLKGTFDMEGHGRASDLAHAIEDVLESVRAGQLEPNGAVVDECLDATDTLTTLLNEVDRYGTTQTDPERHIESLQDVAQRGKEQPTTDTTNRQRGQQQSDGQRREAGAETEEMFDEEVKEALEAADEFADLDALAEEMEEPDNTGEMEGGGSFDDIFDDSPGGTTTQDSSPGEPTATHSQSEGGSGEGETAEQALAAASEFDDLDALAEEMEEPEDIGTLDRGGSFDDIFDDTSDETTTGQTGPESKEKRTETGDRSETGQFAQIKSEVDKEQSLSALQAEIEAEDFGEFDDEDNMTIQELVSLDTGQETGGNDPDYPEPTVETPDEREALRQVFDALAGDKSSGVSAGGQSQAGGDSGLGATAQGGQLEGGLEAEMDLDMASTDRQLESFESRFGADEDTGSHNEQTGAVATLEESSLPAETFRSDRGMSERPTVETPETVQSLTVDIEYADDLLSMVEELSVGLRQLTSQATDSKAVETAESLEGTVRELQQTVMEVRLMPVETITSRLDRVARDAARSTDKQVTLTVEGAGTRVDRSVIDRLGEPLVHLVRNAVDHGIEVPAEREAADKPPTGTVTVSVRRAGEQIVVEVSDDGKGIDPDAVRTAAVEAGVVSQAEAMGLSDEAVYDLVFEPGVSTTETVTDTSGRGVGMDVVREAVEAMNGRLTVESTPPEGTTVRLRLPVTLAVSEVVVVEINGQEFAIPAVDVQRVSSGTGGRVTDALRRVETDRRVDLGRALGLDPVESDTPMVVAVETAAGQLGIECERVVDRRTTIITPYDDLLAGIPELSGAATGTDEQLIHVLDVSNL